MLYISAELSKPRRIQGAFLTEKEISSVTDYLKARGEPQYVAEVTERRHGMAGGATSNYDGGEDEDDIHTATEVVIKAKRASATLLQSRMRVGFAKASRLLDLLEERGIIGPQNSSKPREVILTAEEFRNQQGSNSFSEGFDVQPEAPMTEEDDEDEEVDETTSEDEGEV